MQPNWAMYTLVINKTAYVLYSLCDSGLLYLHYCYGWFGITVELVT